MPEQHNTAQSGGVVYAVQNGDQYVYLYRNEPPYRVQPWPAEPPPVPEPLVRRAPSWLLSARHQVVPFYGRDRELALLRDWREAPTLGASVRLVHAPGGQGKTRLAAQFGQACSRAGWTVALARHRNEAAAAGGGDQQLAVYQRGLVLIIDYAERWPLQDMLTVLGQHQAAASTPLRVLLLARPAGGWWQSLVYQLNKINIGDVEQWELASLAEHLPDRQAVYAAARDRFASVLSLATPAAAAEPDLGGPQFELVLAVHMKALVDVDAATRGLTPPSGRDPARLSCYLLDREHDYWRAAHQQGTGPIRTSELGISRAVYTATLTRALPHREGVTALTRANIGEATTQPIGQVLADHAILYPPTDPATVLEPLYPDRLGEDFLALTTPGHTDSTRTQPWAATLPTQLLTTHEGNGPAPSYARAAITTLIEAAHRWPHLAQRQLYPILRQRPRLAFAAGGAALSRLVDLQHPGILDVLYAITPHLPKGRHVDLDPGIAALTTRLTTHWLATTNDPAQHARLYHTLGYRLANAGQHDQALTATHEAVQIYRRLAGTDPAAFEPHLAESLANLGMMLSNLGRREEALTATHEAVEIRRRVAGVNPAAFEPELARALNNLSFHLSDLGRREEALSAATETLQIYRRLAGFEPDLAKALTSLGIRLSGLGRWEEALEASTEAAEIYRRLAGTDPAAFEPDLAGALTGLGNNLSGLGRWKEALEASTEALEIYRRLARVNPAAFETDLARALNNLSVRLSGLGRSEEALEASTEALQIFRRLASTNPAAFEPHLAIALNNLGLRLVRLGRDAEALEAIFEAVEIRRRLKSVNLAAFEPDLATSLTAFSVFLAKLGRGAEALEAIFEAVEIYRRAARVNPAAFEPDLASALNNLSVHLLGLGRREEALEASTEAVQIYRRLAEVNPAACEPNLAAALTTLASSLSRLERPEEALRASAEALEIYRRLAEVNPASVEPNLARGLWIFARVRVAGQVELPQALTAAKESVTIYRHLAQRQPGAFASDLQGALATLADLRNSLGRSDKAG